MHATPPIRKECGHCGEPLRVENDTGFVSHCENQHCPEKEEPRTRMVAEEARGQALAAADRLARNALNDAVQECPDAFIEAAEEWADNDKMRSLRLAETLCVEAGTRIVRAQHRIWLAKQKKH